MKVAFDFTLDDMVEVAERAAERSGTVKSSRAQARLFVSIAAAVFVWLIFSGSRAWQLVGAALAAAIGWYLYPADFKKAHRKKLRQFMREQFRGDGPFHCEVELADEGLITVQEGSRIVREWKTVAAVMETEDSIDFVFIGSGSLVVRNRAFKSQPEYAAFLQRAREFQNNARNYATFVEKK